MFAAAVAITQCRSDKYAKRVDPLIGSGGHGHVFVGACLPFGLVQAGPSNIAQGWDWCSGYHDSDSTIIGFSHMHLSGTGIGDLGDINLLPATGNPTLRRGSAADGYKSGQYSLFRKETEKVEAGYYAVRLDRYDVDAELTATTRCALHKYTYGTLDNPQVVIDLVNGQAWDRPVEAYIVQENATTISGYRYSKGWANDQKIYFTMEFSHPMEAFLATAIRRNGDSIAGQELRDRWVYGQALFSFAQKTTLYVKVALSPTSIANAKKNMQAEFASNDWDFEYYRRQAAKAWNSELSKIDIKADERTQKIFYTALYHTMIAPSVLNDVSGDYRGADGMMHSSDGFVNYTTFSLWDTYRAAHPLMSIIHPEKMNDIISTMLHIYKQQGKLPVWHLMGCETDCMVGNPGISVVADAILKGYDGFDKALAYEAIKNSAMLDERGLKYLKEYGYIPFDKEEEGLSKCMEYAIADWAIAQVAKSMGKQEDYQYFLDRSKAYRHYFDASIGFMRGKDAAGKFRERFNPFEAVHRDNDYTEGNAWQYTWLVPHDIEGLVELFGGRERFVSKLDSLFIVKGDLGAHASPDITGLIGQYAHGNEPSHHIIYMYPFVGQQWKTAKLVRQVLSEMYSDQRDGLSGNEDVGQMSAWYVLSALGLYQVEPAGGRYVFGSPIVESARIKVGDGRFFSIHAHNNSPDNKYIQSVTLNGKPYDKFYIDYADIMAGGTLEFTMTNEAGK